MKKKILITGASGMLAYDFQKYEGDIFEIFPYTKEELDITSPEDIEIILEKIQPDVVLNCAAYTKVDDAEDIGMKLNYDINTLGVFFLAHACEKQGIDFITISTDYVFSGEQETWYSEIDVPNPINAYGTAKYLGEKIAQEIYQNTIIVRTSWLYGGGKEFKNFVNTILKLSETRSELKVVADQFGIPTSTKDLSFALWTLIQDITSYRGKMFHFSNTSTTGKVSWADFAHEIFHFTGKDTTILPCSSKQYPTKAKRPSSSLLLNHSDIQLPEWKRWLQAYLETLS